MRTPSQQENFDTIQRGREIYEQHIKALVEPDNIGKVLVINVDTGEYEMGSNDAEISHYARAKYPTANLYAMRIGYKTLYHMGKRMFNFDAITLRKHLSVLKSEIKPSAG